jgi:hypothetical protein
VSDGKYPREFEINGVDIEAPGIRLGPGTKVRIGTPMTEQLPTQPPMPDEEALVFLLRNHDHARLVWPAAEGVEEERDCYPVAGWQKNYDRETDEDALICSRCAEDLKAAKAKLKETRRKK